MLVYKATYLCERKGHVLVDGVLVFPVTFSILCSKASSTLELPNRSKLINKENPNEETTKGDLFTQRR